MKSDNQKQTVHLAVVVVVLLALSLGLKIALLMTSQSMADGDESVEGIMAMHLVEEGTFQVYPYGVNYGAGAGVEVLIAALTFKLFGVSDVTVCQLQRSHCCCFHSHRRPHNGV